MPLVLLIMAAIYAGTGWLAAHDPATLSGYTLMSGKRREAVDIQSLARFAARLLYACAVISLLGLAALPFAWRDAAVAVTLVLPVPVLLAGTVWGWWKYDRRFLKRQN